MSDGKDNESQSEGAESDYMSDFVFNLNRPPRSSSFRLFNKTESPPVSMLKPKTLE